MIRLRPPLPAFALLALFASASGQRPDAPDLEQLSSADAFARTPQWLLTGDPRQRAWAAYWIGRDRQEPEIPLLLDALENYEGNAALAPSAWSDDDFAVLMLLDTLIQLDVDVSPDLAEPLYARFPAQTIILLSRSREDAREVLLSILDKTKSKIDWLAAADVLAANAPPGFIARLLRAISIHATIQVLSPGQGGMGGGMGGSCGGSNDDGPRFNWPPVGAYRLSAQPFSDSELLVAGEDPVYLIRTQTRVYGRGAHWSSDCDAWQGFATISGWSRDLIGQLLGVKKDDFALQLMPSTGITWKSAKSYLEAASSFVLMQKQILYDTEAALKARGLLSDIEFTSIHPPLEVQVLDMRKDKTPLPNLAFADPFITVIHENVDWDPPE